jgi:2-keto-3-deoxy-6-phosphogluconate aldolase
LNPEELIYSMYKTVFPKAKNIVEDAGAGFIVTPVVISEVIRSS